MSEDTNDPRLASINLKIQQERRKLELAEKRVEDLRKAIQELESAREEVSVDE